MDSLLVERLGWTLLHFVWEGLILALLLAVALLLTRRKTSTVRYGLASGTLLLMGLLPVATFMATAPADPLVSHQITAQGVVLTVHLAAPRTIDQLVHPYLPGLVLGWGCGALMLTLRMLGGLVQVELLKRRGRQASEEIQLLFNEAARRLGVRRKVIFRICDQTRIPCAIGVFRVVVLMPAEMITRLPVEYLEALLLHELAHVRRHDYLVNLLQTLLETVLFYHPAVWWVSKVIREEREHCCDDLAVKVLGSPVAYARALTTLEEQRSALPHLSLAANGGTLLSRIQRIFGITLPSRFTHSALPLAAVLALTVTTTSAAVQAHAHKPNKSTVKKTTKSSKQAPKHVSKSVSISSSTQPGKPRSVTVTTRSGTKTFVIKDSAFARSGNPLAVRVVDKDEQIRMLEARIRELVKENVRVSDGIAVAERGTTKAQNAAVAENAVAVTEARKAAVAADWAATQARTAEAASLQRGGGFGGGGFGGGSTTGQGFGQTGLSGAAHVSIKPHIEILNDGRCKVDFEEILATRALVELARATDLGLMIKDVRPVPITLIMPLSNPSDVIKKICEAAGYEVTQAPDFVFVVSPRGSAPMSPTVKGD